MTIITGMIGRTATWLKQNPIAGLRAPARPVPLHVVVLTSVYGLVAVGIGLSTGLLHPAWPALWQVVVLPLLLIVYPSLLEELFFRGVLMPRSLLDAPRWKQGAALAASTAIFVAYHPINAATLSLSDTSMFSDPAFLGIVTMLGLVCGYAYLRTGSLRIPVAIHWATVLVWNLALGRPW